MDLSLFFVERRVFFPWIVFYRHIKSPPPEVGLIGPNGCGKSTQLLMLMKQVSPGGGRTLGLKNPEKANPTQKEARKNGGKMLPKSSKQVLNRYRRDLVRGVFVGLVVVFFFGGGLVNSSCFTLISTCNRRKLANQKSCSFL